MHVNTNIYTRSMGVSCADADHVCLNSFGGALVNASEHRNWAELRSRPAMVANELFST